MRMTIPRSQGKQAYYDARKSTWGDMFPHPSKNKEVERYRPPTEGVLVGKGRDIGKRGNNRDGKKTKYSYEKLGNEIQSRKKDERWQRRKERSQLIDLD